MDVGLDNLNLFRGEVVLREKWPQGLQVFGLEGVFFYAGARALGTY